MAVEDLWLLTDGATRSKRWGRGLRYRVRVNGHAKSFHSKRAADQYWRDQLDESSISITRGTVNDLVDQWLRTKKNLSPKGYEACTDAVARVRLAEFSDKRASDVAAIDVRLWWAEHTGAPSTRNKDLQCLRGAFKLAIADGLLRKDPTAEIKQAKEIPRDPIYLEPDDLKRLAAAAGDVTGEGAADGEAMVLFLGTVGVRIGECCALNVGDVDVKTGRAKIGHAKSATRYVGIPAKVLAMLDLQRPRTAPLFTSREGKRIYPTHWRARAFKTAKEASGLAELHIHDLRHTAASLAIQSGADVKVVQNMLGHRSAKMTLDVYGHLWDKGVDDVAIRLNSLL